MGDRAIIILHSDDRHEVGPCVYLHWGGRTVPALLDDLKALMSTRPDDVPYATARLIGLAHVAMPGNLSLGVWNPSPDLQHAIACHDAKRLAEASHGDAGLILVNVHDFTWRAFGGYLARVETLNP
jgi:hypothetical protein